MPQVIRSAGAVLAGVFAIAALSTLTDLVMHAAGVFPPAGEPMGASLWVLAIVYRSLFAVGSGFITARLAPAREIKHAIVLGFVGVVLSLAGAAATWNAGPAYGPHWYSIALVAIALPCSWAGGNLYRTFHSVKTPAAGPRSSEPSAITN